MYRLRCLRQFRRKYEGHYCIDLSIQALVRVLHLYPKELDDDSQLSKELGGAEPGACKGSSPGDSSRHVWGVIREVPQFLDLFAPHFQKRNPTDYRPFDHQVHLQSVPNPSKKSVNRRRSSAHLGRTVGAGLRGAGFGTLSHKLKPFQRSVNRARGFDILESSWSRFAILGCG